MPGLFKVPACSLVWYYSFMRLNTKTVSVYEIVNLKTGRRYVGSSARPFSRFALHLWQLASGRHKNPRMQADWSAIDDWAFRILESGVPVELRTSREAALIPSAGYNIRSESPSLLARTEKINLAIRLRADGHTYRHISAQTQMSLGWVAYVLRQ